VALISDHIILCVNYAADRFAGSWYRFWNQSRIPHRLAVTSMERYGNIVLLWGHLC